MGTNDCVIIVKKKSEELTLHIMDMAICGIPISKDKEQKLYIEHTSRNS